MKIGIDCRTILNPHGGERAGVGHYTYFLVKNLLKVDKQNNYVLFFDSRFKAVEEFKRYTNVKIVWFPFSQYKKYLPLTYSHLLISAILNREKLDIFHSPANVIPLNYNKPSVVTVHDLGIYKYPEFFPKKYLSNQAFATRVLVPRSLTRAKKIIAVSKNTKRDIVEQFNVEEEKIEVIYEGVLSGKDICAKNDNLLPVRQKYGIKNKYILFLGTIEPRKNIVNLIKAFRNLYLVYDSPLKDYQLIIAGSHGWQDEPVYQEIASANASILGIKEKRNGRERRSGVDSRPIDKQIEQRKGLERRQNQPIKYIGYVTHNEKMLLLCNTDCFVFPSLYEGFGLPVLEAMSVGTPIITSNNSSLPEVTGSQGALLVDPNKESEIADALQQVVTDAGLRESLIVNGHKRSKYFSWRKCARHTLKIYQEAVKSE